MSEVRKGMAAFIKQIHETKRPLVITQRGKSAAVFIDAQEYEAMREKIALFSDVQTALGQLAKASAMAMRGTACLIGCQHPFSRSDTASKYYPLMRLNHKRKLVSLLLYVLTT